MSTRTPTLCWALPAGFAATQVNVCRDAAFNNVVWTQVVTGSVGSVGTTLPTGMIQWQPTTMNTDGVTPESVVSPTWEFAVLGTHSAPHMTSCPDFADVNGDGDADYLVGGRGTTVQELPGSSPGLLDLVESSWAGSSGECGGAAFIQGGDINGDAYSDVVGYDCGGIQVLLRSSSGWYRGSAAIPQGPALADDANNATRFW